MKKKIVALLLMCIMCLSVVTGCNLFQTNWQKYYEAVVASITYVDGTYEEITKRDLMLAYSSYGSNYLNYGYSGAQAIETTLNTIVNNKIKAKHVKDYYAEKDTEGNFVHGAELLENEYTYLWESTWSALYDQLADKYYTVNKITAPADPEEEQENNLVYKEYTSQAQPKLEDGKYVIKINSENVEKSVRDSFKPNYKRNYETNKNGTQTDKEVMYQKLIALFGDKKTESEKLWKNAFDEYITTIKDNYSYKTFKNDEECFKFEMDRVYKIIKENYYAEKYNDIYSKQTGISTLTVQELVDAYADKVVADYTTYKIMNGSDYESQMLSNVLDMDYVLEDGAQFFNVAYIKMEFGAELTETANNLKADYEAGTIDDYESEMKLQVYDNVYASHRDETTGEKQTEVIDGKTVTKLSERVNASTLRAQILGEIGTSDDYVDETKAENDAELEYMKHQNQEIANEKAQKFIKYLYYYNDDDTLKNAESNTVFGFKNGEILANDTFKDMDDVKDAIKELYQNGNAKIGNISRLAKADDGYYLFFFAGKVENVFKTITSDFSLKEEDVETLMETKLNIFSDKTLFDKLYEELASNSSSAFQTLHMERLKEEIVAGNGTGVVFYPDNYKDLY